MAFSDFHVYTQIGIFVLLFFDHLVLVWGRTSEDLLVLSSFPKVPLVPVASTCSVSLCVSLDDGFSPRPDLSEHSWLGSLYRKVVYSRQGICLTISKMVGQRHERMQLKWTLFVRNTRAWTQSDRECPPQHRWTVFHSLVFVKGHLFTCRLID